MAESLYGGKWKIADAKNKIAAIMPQLPTLNRTFTLGAANMIWYKSKLLVCQN